MSFDFLSNFSSQEINYQYEEIDFGISEKEIFLINQWIERIIEQEGKEYTTINYIFCSDEYLHAINVKYLQHDTLTDIITFSLSDQLIESDIYISIDRVRENALQFNLSFKDELYRVMIHGILHLCGYGDKTPLEKKIMTQKENHALELLKTFL